ncbi:MAG TPA: M56 family metallopeptidase, partial [Thermoguttaceae bacterium]|nr:M56 family metallopeptidase [Thermoguttaceae bacterium]
VVFLARVAVTCRRLARLRASAAIAGPGTLGVCREVASVVGVVPPEVRHSPCLHGPCLAGLRRPAVLLPEAWIEMRMSLRDVLIHELAHLRRRDCHWNLLGRLAVSLGFFQPLLWMLVRRLRAAAEEVCDDWVVQHGGDRRAYAHGLVDIAELSSSTLASAGVGMVSFRSMLARRIARIMDTSRSLSTRAGYLCLTLVVAGGLLGTGVVGLVGVGARPVVAKTEIAAEESPAAAAEADDASTPEPPAAKAAQDDAKAFESTDDRTTITGRVVDVEGKPIVGAVVAAIARRAIHESGGDRDAQEVLAEATTDRDGRYQLDLADALSQSHEYPQLVVRANGKGLVWKQFHFGVPRVEASFRLVDEQPVRVQLLGVSGQPAAGVRVTTNSMSMPPSAKQMYDGVTLGPSKAAPPAMITDEQGRFVMHHVRPGGSVSLVISGTEQFARQELIIGFGTDKDKPVIPLDVPSHRQAKNLKPGEEAVFTLAPAQVITGTVRRVDTNQPVAHARVVVNTHYMVSHWVFSVAGTTDAEGRYRISPYPGTDFEVIAYSPDGEPYLTRKIDDIAWNGKARVKRIDVNLPRGVLVRGRVVESPSGNPIAGAAVQYIPERFNNSNTTDVITGWQGLRLADKDGRFAMAVLPGLGRLVVHGPGSEYVLRDTSEEELDRGKPGGRRHHVNAVERIDPKPDAAPIDLTIKLTRGATVAGRIVNEQGEPIREARMISRRNVTPGNLDWQAARSPRVWDGRFELSGLEEGRPETVYFLDAKNRLGATAVLRAGDKPSTVVLRPCGQARAAFVDQHDRPVEGVTRRDTASLS